MRKLKFIYGLFISLIKNFPLRFAEKLGNCFSEDSYGCKIRGALYKPFLKKCGVNFQVGLGAKLEHLNNLEFGDDVYIGHGSWISGLRGGIEFENQVMLGPYVKIVSSNHLFDETGSARFKKGEGEKIHIGYGTWIAAGAVITSGSIVGKGCLIAAGAVVTKQFGDKVVIGGIPAKILKDNEY